ncbi:MAG: universal stress protein [Deltaproteobacteria bacterium]|nr:universal stress protein [Deltaproteobacteria bacterium]
MKILLAVDDSVYSRYAAAEAVKLACNAWADVTILGLCDKKKTPAEGPGCPPDAGPWQKGLTAFEQMFREQGPPDDNPYIPLEESLEWVEVSKGVWEEFRVLRGVRKDLRVRLRAGDGAQVLIEDTTADYDLIVLGCGPGGESLAGPGPGNATLQKIVENSRASVLLVKQDQDIHKIVCCLDNSEVPQANLEMINLLATIHQATLELLGLTREGWIQIEVDNKLSNLWRYFSTTQSQQVVTGFKEHSKLEPFVSNQARPDLLVLWRGKQSILNTLFPKKWLGDLLTKSQSSVLVLR